jgi:hypothetical protein
MLDVKALEAAFNLYWEDIDQYEKVNAYWSLLHVTVCIPDICSALESNNCEATGLKYKKWCKRFLADRKLTAKERYRMRCKVLHQVVRPLISQANVILGSRFHSQLLLE